jgi:hypothetical protein
MQQYNAAQQYTGLVDVLRKTYKNEGFLAFYKGYGHANPSQVANSANAYAESSRIRFESFQPR